MDDQCRECPATSMGRVVVILHTLRMNGRSLCDFAQQNGEEKGSLKDPVEGVGKEWSVLPGRARGRNRKKHGKGDQDHRSQNLGLERSEEGKNEGEHPKEESVVKEAEERGGGRRGGGEVRPLHEGNPDLDRRLGFQSFSTWPSSI